MKTRFFIFVLLLSLLPVSALQAQQEIPSAVNTALQHLNEYLLVPIDLEEQGIEWDWEVLIVDDFGDNCRERQDQSAELPTVVYDIHFYRLAEDYHYRLSMDEQLIVPCVPLATVPENAKTPVVDALSDLNRRLHFNFTTNDLPWTWREVRFDDYTLDCPMYEAPEANFDQTINGYIVEFRVAGESYTYHVSQDRLIVIFCQELAEEG